MLCMNRLHNLCYIITLPRVFYTNIKFIVKHLWQSLFLIKRQVKEAPEQMVFCMNCVKFVFFFLNNYKKLFSFRKVWSFLTKARNFLLRVNLFILCLCLKSSSKNQNQQSPRVRKTFQYTPNQKSSKSIIFLFYA